MKFVEFPKDYSIMYVLSLFRQHNKLPNEVVLEKSLVFDDKIQKKAFELYTSGLVSMKDADFQINISMFNVIDEMIESGYMERDPETHSLTITQSGKKLFSNYNGNQKFMELCEFTAIHLIDGLRVDWQRFSKDLISILKINYG
jgi:hypothetical protein